MVSGVKSNYPSDRGGVVLHLCEQVQAETPFGLLLNVAHPDGKETGDTAEILSCLDWGKKCDNHMKLIKHHKPS